MFKFLKEKLKSAFNKITRKVDEKAEEERKKLEQQLEEIKKEEIGEKKEVEKLEREAKKAEKDEAKKIKNVEEIIEEKKEEIEEEKKSLLQKIKEKFTTTKISEADFEEIFDQLELVLLENNVALEVVGKIKQELKYKIIDKTIKRAELEQEIKIILSETLSKIMTKPFNLIEKIKEEKKPFVIVFFGINGSGKTTTIAKIAHLLKKEKLSCILAAADTFRAASIEQLEKHALKLQVNMVKHQYGADPAAVAFDAISHAKSKNIDVVLIDTAGRMHTKTDLMREMEKIIRVAKPNLKIFVAESIVGNDAVEQGKTFNETIGIDAIILTKADVDEKGGASISMSFVTNKPIIYLGTGQEYKDLELFEPEKIVKSIIA
jgi:fused signal recognition particle receptor